MLEPYQDFLKSRQIKERFLRDLSDKKKKNVAVPRKKMRVLAD